MENKKKTEFEQQRFFDQSYERCMKAEEKAGVKPCFYDVGGTIVEVRFVGERMPELFMPALQHLRLEGNPGADVTFCVWDSKSSGVEMVPPPCEWSAFTDRGDIFGFNSKRIRTAFHWGDFSVNLMDKQRKLGIYWVENPANIPYWSMGSPLRTLFHWWMQENDAQLLHAAAVGTEDEAVVITGKGGVGKSTTALSCLDYGLKYLADDYLIIKGGEVPRVFSLYDSAKLNPEDIPRFPSLAPYIAERYGKDQEKDMLFLYPELRERLAHSLPLKAILTPSFGEGNETRIRQVPFWTMQGNMSFTTISQLPYAGERTHKFISDLCKRIPIFELQLGKDVALIPPVLETFIREDDGVQEEVESLVPEKDDGLPLISVIVPVYNGAEFVKDCVKSIQSQDYPAFEIIFIDDGSTDGSGEVIKNLDIQHRYLYQENAGPAAARNTGIRNASGEFIAFLDVDDLWPENNIHYLLHFFREDPELMIVHGYGQLLELNEESGVYEYTGNPEEGFTGYISAGLYRREVFDRVGLYNEELKFGEDGDWFMRVEEIEVPMKKLKEVTLFVRRHGGNMTEGKSLVELNALEVFKRSLDRKRLGRKMDFPPPKETLPISVVVPCYNGEKYLAEALESILRKEVRPAEVIVVDDGSHDASVRVARSFEPHIRLIRQENQGAAAARNRGVEAATREFLAFLDADDLWEKDMPERLFRKLEKRDDLDMVFGNVEQFLSPELDASQRAGLRNELANMPGFVMGAMLVRMSSYEKVGQLDESLQLAEFIDWMSRAEQTGLKYEVLDEVVMRRRLHTTNQGVTKKQHMDDYAKVLRSALKRKRGESGD